MEREEVVRCLERHMLKIKKLFLQPDFLEKGAATLKALYPHIRKVSDQVILEICMTFTKNSYLILPERREAAMKAHQAYKKEQEKKT